MKNYSVVLSNFHKQTDNLDDYKNMADFNM